ncbi:hypothetical protein FOCG_09673 [Fusarium oxysporum f. sp. radicis-lycopersici 26381]|uniref:Uncharacterized protein n=1 Tax=Fusarium oxysporum Fo47 TaxID=660027 RepID=W9LAX3_FUSOX|nr:hypothetical protein FOZG_00874 [Fusarium oxysporum Fo47]EWZ92260.1 hypothetical protein FOWG_07457 [Fusarium oxysporum f. sp. lycopersici MN25]EXL49222.1 hypothetical protein FOCG_09673 [Fusarium oxysporum f. sp. radicis-lycopersici 26381]
MPSLMGNLQQQPQIRGAELIVSGVPVRFLIGEN